MDQGHLPIVKTTICASVMFFAIIVPKQSKKYTVK